MQLCDLDVARQSLCRQPLNLPVAIRSWVMLRNEADRQTDKQTYEVQCVMRSRHKQACQTWDHRQLYCPSPERYSYSVDCLFRALGCVYLPGARCTEVRLYTASSQWSWSSGTEATLRRCDVWVAHRLCLSPSPPAARETVLHAVGILSSLTVCPSIPLSVPRSLLTRKQKNTTVKLTGEVSHISSNWQSNYEVRMSQMKGTGAKTNRAASCRPVWPQWLMPAIIWLFLTHQHHQHVTFTM